MLLHGPGLGLDSPGLSPGPVHCTIEVSASGFSLDLYTVSKTHLKFNGYLKNN